MALMISSSVSENRQGRQIIYSPQMAAECSLVFTMGLSAKFSYQDGWIIRTGIEPVSKNHQHTLRQASGTAGNETPGVSMTLYP